MNYWGLLGYPIGLFYICASVYDWEWFFNRGKQGQAVHLFGRKNARILYGVLGLTVMVMGSLAMFKLPPFHS